MPQPINCFDIYGNHPLRRYGINISKIVLTPFLGYRFFRIPTLFTQVPMENIGYSNSGCKRRRCIGGKQNWLGASTGFYQIRLLEGYDRLPEMVEVILVFLWTETVDLIAEQLPQTYAGWVILFINILLLIHGQEAIGSGEWTSMQGRNWLAAHRRFHSTKLECDQRYWNSHIIVSARSR